MNEHEIELKRVSDLVKGLKAIDISQSQLDDLRLLYETPQGFKYTIDKKNAPQGATLGSSRKVGSNIKKALGITSSLPYGMSFVGYGDQKTSTWRMNSTFRAAVDRLGWFSTGNPNSPDTGDSTVSDTGFEAWLIENGSSAKTASNYAGAIAGRLKDLAIEVEQQGFALTKIDAKEAFGDFCENHDGSGEIKALNVRGKDMYRRALVWYAKFFASQVAPTSIEGIEERLSEQVTKSLGDTPSARAARLARAGRIPNSVTVTTVVYERNPDVVAQILFEAKGSCQGCGNKAPFIRKSDKTPYLEVHHRTPLASGGEDTVANAIALCPNCHRERHYGI
jgi:hypothetical protein